MLNLPESLGLPGACLRGFSASLAILPTPVKKREHIPETSSVVRSSSRNSARTEEREGRCLRSPCRSGPCSGDRQLGFWGASTWLPKSLRLRTSSSSRSPASPSSRKHFLLPRHVECWNFGIADGRVWSFHLLSVLLSTCFSSSSVLFHMLPSVCFLSFYKMSYVCFCQIYALRMCFIFTVLLLRM